jgi:hypothetical protein
MAVRQALRDLFWTVGGLPVERTPGGTLFAFSAAGAARIVLKRKEGEILQSSMGFEVVDEAAQE